MRTRCCSRSRASYDLSLQNAKNLQASIQPRAEAAMKLADRQLRDTEIRAPFDGYVEKRFVERRPAGEGLRHAGTVMSVVRIDPLQGDQPRFPRRWRRGSAIGQAVELHVDAYPDRAIAGKVVAHQSGREQPRPARFPFEALVPNRRRHPRSRARSPAVTGARADRTGSASLTLSLRGASVHRYGVNRVFVVDGDQLVAQELRRRRAARRSHRDRQRRQRRRPVADDRRGQAGRRPEGQRRRRRTE